MGICAKTYCKKKRLSQESSPKSSPKSSPNLVQSSVYNMPYKIPVLKDKFSDNGFPFELSANTEVRR